MCFLLILLIGQHFKRLQAVVMARKHCKSMAYQVTSMLAALQNFVYQQVDVGNPTIFSRSCYFKLVT